MASWSNTDAVTGLATARYTVAANAAADGTVTVTGTGSSFGIDGSAGVGDVIRFGAADRSRTINVGTGHTYFGDAVIVAVASSESITIGSSAGLSQVGFTTSAKFSRLPKSSVKDQLYSELSPSATLSYKIAEQDDFSSTVNDRTQQTLKATASWPLFAGGRNLFGLRKEDVFQKERSFGPGAKYKKWLDENKSVSN